MNKFAVYSVLLLLFLFSVSSAPYKEPFTANIDFNHFNMTNGGYIFADMFVGGVNASGKNISVDVLKSQSIINTNNISANYIHALSYASTTLDPAALCTAGLALRGHVGNMSNATCGDYWLDSSGDTWSGNQNASENNLTNLNSVFTDNLYSDTLEYISILSNIVMPNYNLSCNVSTASTITDGVATIFSGSITGLNDLNGSGEMNIATVNTGNGDNELYAMDQDTLTTSNVQHQNMILTGNLTVDNGTLFADSSNDRVGIGTTNPTGKLEIANVAANANVYLETYSGSTDTSEIWFRKSHSSLLDNISATQTAEQLGTINWIGGTSLNSFDTGAQIKVIQDGASGSTVPSNMIFSTWSDSAQNANQLVLHNDGKIGLGTDAPTSTLDILGTLNVSGLTNFADKINTQNISVSKYIHHLGDGDTWMVFSDDQIIFRAGNVELLTVTEATTDIVAVNGDFNAYGLLYVNSTSSKINVNSNMTATNISLSGILTDGVMSVSGGNITGVSYINITGVTDGAITCTQYDSLGCATGYNSTCRFWYSPDGTGVLSACNP